MKPKHITVDVETTGLNWIDDQLHGVGIAIEDQDAKYYPAWDIPVIIRQYLADPEIAKIGHNLHAFDAKFLRKNGLDIQGEFDDTMVLANLIDPDMSLGLKFLADKYLGEESLDRKRRLDQYCTEQDVKSVAGLCAKDLLDNSRPHLEIIADYCCEDVNNTTRLYFKFLERLREMDAVLKSKLGLAKSPLDYYYEEARPLEKVLFEMEYRGIRVNMSAIEELRDAAKARAEFIERRLTKVFVNKITAIESSLYEKEISKLSTDKAKATRAPGKGKCKFQWSNNNHVGSLLYEHCGLSLDLVQKTKKGKYRTDKDAVSTIVQALPEDSRLRTCLELYVDYKLQLKLLTTYTGDNNKGIVSKIRYVDGIPRIFPIYRQTTGTGRLACSNPNMQNLKRDSLVKRFFIPDCDDEVFDDADYSQIELRVAAHLSRDPSLVDAYVNNRDVHLQTASALFGREITKADDLERQAGKRTNFLTIFDGKEFRLQQSLKADTGREFSLDECERFIKLWFQTYPVVRSYLDNQLKFFQKHRICVSETGRIRRLPDIIHGRKPYYLRTRDESKAYNHATKAGFNMPIQGLAASMTKRAMIALYRLGRLPANQVHDNLTVARKHWDIEAKKQLVQVMETVYPLTVPVTADVKTLLSFHPKDKYNTGEE